MFLNLGESDWRHKKRHWQPVKTTRFNESQKVNNFKFRFNNSETTVSTKFLFALSVITALAGCGGGGGGGAINSSNGGSGGSGVAILSVPTSSYSGVTTGSPTITISGTNTIIKFTASGTYTA